VVYPDVDKMFLEEMNNHNTVIGMTSELQSALTIITKFGLGINTFIHDILDFIQRKEYDNAAKILSDAVYSIDQLARELERISLLVQSGVLKVYEQEDKGFEELF
jgi:hypothetical protein